MIDSPTWFFSTLAQATAGIVAFIIAIATVVYSLERQRRERQTAEFKKDLLNFKEKYESLLWACSTMFHSVEIDCHKDYITDNSLSDEELRGQIESDEDQPLEKSALVHSHIRNNISLITDISPDDSLPSQRWMAQFMAEIGWLRSFMMRTGADRNAELYSEITGTPVDEVPGFQHYFQDIFVDRPIPEAVAEVTGEHPQRVTGKNLYTLEILSESMFTDFAALHQRVSGTTIGYEPDIKPILKLSAYLVVIGVIFPLISMIFVPEQYAFVQFNGSLIIALQVLSLLFTILISIVLFDLLIQGIYPRTNMNETDNLTRISRYTLRILPGVHN